ncbi:hypothetical protein PFLUV_G00028410 [Perca fluviatilis]|uniref:Uncharacterized protein n=1 Tax=Perca fluviatilis TaxID=8168 RepID=A0A6A5FMP1_PERFL|nr:hypothetical protein PFLUV_G00028410 [Perca fluviatilis]
MRRGFLCTTSRRSATSTEQYKHNSGVRSKTLHIRNLQRLIMIHSLMAATVIPGPPLWRNPASSRLRQLDANPWPVVRTPKTTPAK